MWATTFTPSVRFPLDSIPGGSRIPLLAAAGVDFVSALTVAWEDNQYVDRTDDPRLRQPSFFRLNGSIGVQSERQGWSVKLACENMTDVATITQAREVTLGPGNFVQLLEPPRLVFGSVRWSF
jgi:hypothetical protein